MNGVTSVNKLPVLKTVGASYGFVLLNLRDFLRTAWLPIVVLVVMLAIQGMPEPVPETTADEPPRLPGTGILFAVLIFVVIGVTVQVAWYRRVLLGPDGLPAGFPLALGRREGRYFIRMTGIVMLMLMLLLFALNVLGGILPAGSPGAITMGYTALAVILLGEYYIASRLSLVLPATTVDAGTSFGQAWRLGQDNGWRIVLVLLGVQLPITLAWFTIQVPTANTDSALLYYAAGIAFTALSLFGHVLSATAMSLCFVQLGGLAQTESDRTFS